MTAELPKLVRDRIQALYPHNEYRTATDEEMLGLLADKVREEAEEVAAELLTLSGTQDRLPVLVSLAGELADLTEVCRAVTEHCGLSLWGVERARLAKRRERGGFTRGIVLTAMQNTSAEETQEP